MSTDRWKPEQRHTHGDEEDGKNAETHELDGLATPGIDEEEGNPISRNKAGNGENKVSDTDVVETLVDIERGTCCGRTATEVNGSQDDRAVETETIKGDLETC
jgi:hypothetical protein